MYKNTYSVQLSRSVMFDSVTPWIAARQASLSITSSRSSLRFTSNESVMPSSHLILCRPFLLLPPIPPSIRVFSNIRYFSKEWALLIKWPKYWNFSFSISPSNEYSGLIYFRIDWLDLLAFQGTLKSLLQHHSLRISILWCSAFFRVQLSHSYMTIEKNIALTMPLTAKLVCDQTVKLLLTNPISLCHLAYSFVCSRYSTDIHWVDENSLT